MVPQIEVCVVRVALDDVPRVRVGQREVVPSLHLQLRAPVEQVHAHLALLQIPGPGEGGTRVGGGNTNAIGSASEEAGRMETASPV